MTSRRSQIRVLLAPPIFFIRENGCSFGLKAPVFVARQSMAQVKLRGCSQPAKRGERKFNCKLLRKSLTWRMSARLTQLVECFRHMENAGGSSPSASTNLIRKLKTPSKSEGVLTCKNYVYASAVSTTGCSAFGRRPLLLRGSPENWLDEKLFKRFTISIAEIAASKPLLPDFAPARSIAC